MASRLIASCSAFSFASRTPEPRSPAPFGRAVKAVDALHAQSIATSIECECPQFEAILPLSCAVLPMTTITIPLSDERVAQLRLRAAEVGLPPEEFLRRRVEQLLDRPDEQFQKASEYLLQKNAELYRRLA
jgi:hypothetical protein